MSMRRFNDDPAAHDLRIKLIELGRLLAHVAFDRRRRRHVAKGDLQGNFHISRSSSLYCSSANLLVYSRAQKNGKRCARHTDLVEKNAEFSKELFHLSDVHTRFLAYLRINLSKFLPMIMGRFRHC